jgi:hypothetical protein
MPRTPDLKKARLPPLVQAKTLSLLGVFDGRARELLASADAISEGQARDEARDGTGELGRVWYGSTSILLHLDNLSTDQRQTTRAALEHDLHFRARVLRFVAREASLRAPCTLGVLTCEVRFANDPGGLRIDVDVQAPLIEGRRRAK